MACFNKYENDLFHLKRQIRVCCDYLFTFFGDTNNNLLCYIGHRCGWCLCNQGDSWTRQHISRADSGRESQPVGNLSVFKNSRRKNYWTETIAIYRIIYVMEIALLGIYRTRHTFSLQVYLFDSPYCFFWINICRWVLVKKSQYRLRVFAIANYAMSSLSQSFGFLTQD